MPAFVSGTRKLFNNTSAPTGWATDGKAYDHALRIVNTGVQKPFSTNTFQGLPFWVFNGIDSGIKIPANGPRFSFGTNNFTIEFWCNLRTVDKDFIFFDSRNTATGGVLNPVIGYSPAYGFYFMVNNGYYYNAGTGSIVANRWYHVAVCRYKGATTTNTTLFVNGTLITIVADTSNYQNTWDLYIGRCNPNGGQPMVVDGFIYSFRITLNTAVYLNYPFTPPQTVLTTTQAAGSGQAVTSTNVVLLTCYSDDLKDYCQYINVLGFTNVFSSNGVMVTGGSVNFSSIFNTFRDTGGAVSWSPGTFTVTISPASMDIPAHSHTYTSYPSNVTLTNWLTTLYGGTSYGTVIDNFNFPQSNATPRTTSTSGVTTGHTHTMGVISFYLNGSNTNNMKIKYVDLILCKKN